MTSRSLESAQLIHEKILQRFVFEKFNESAAVRRGLLPPRLRRKAAKFRVLIPEYDLHRPHHRTDFRLIFRDGIAQNIEVEWTTSRFRHGKATAKNHYSNGKGFVIVLEDDRSRAADYTKSLDVIEISAEEFSWWFSKNARRILDSTIAVHAASYHVRQRKYWVVYVGKGAGSQEDYLERGRPGGIWAFRYTQGRNLTNIISMLKGDVVVFATKWRVPGGRRIYPGEKWRCEHVDIFEVTRGYYANFRDRTFEKRSWSKRPEDKEFMHYFRFSASAKQPWLFRTESRILLEGGDLKSGDLGHEALCDALRKSNTQAGAPVELSDIGFESLVQLLARK
jgi:hypothetical protein